MKNETKVICATTAFGMGVNKADVRLVVLWHAPKTLETYLQQVRLQPNSPNAHLPTPPCLPTYPSMFAFGAQPSAFAHSHVLNWLMYEASQGLPNLQI